MAKTLYVSDLDGTLLGTDKRLSKFTQSTLNSLIQDGMLFAYATARSFESAALATEGLSDKAYCITYNGTFISRGKVLHSNFFTAEQVEQILFSLISRNIYPTVYSFINGKEKASYYIGNRDAVMQSYRNLIKDDKRCNPVNSVRSLAEGDVFYFAVKFELDALIPVYNDIKDKFNCLFYKDAYDGLYWLEVQPENASKAQAIIKLKNMLGCDSVICFGDGTNDISMFSVADKSYAVDNAEQAVKKLASGIIPSNKDNGVAVWLKENFNSITK